jgi:hypothetical protein
VFGLVFDRDVLMDERVMQRVAKKFFQARNRLDSHHIPRSIDLTEYIGIPSVTIEPLMSASYRDAAADFRKPRPQNAGSRLATVLTTAPATVHRSHFEQRDEVVEVVEVGDHMVGHRQFGWP